MTRFYRAETAWPDAGQGPDDTRQAPFGWKPVPDLIRELVSASIAKQGRHLPMAERVP